MKLQVNFNDHFCTEVASVRLQCFRQNFYRFKIFKILKNLGEVKMIQVWALVNTMILSWCLLSTAVNRGLDSKPTFWRSSTRLLLRWVQWWSSMPTGFRNHWAIASFIFTTTCDGRLFAVIHRFAALTYVKQTAVGDAALTLLVCMRTLSCLHQYRPC